MNELPKSESIRDLQSYIWQMNIQRGFNTEDPAKKLIVLIEEVGELAKAIRKTAGLKFTATTEQKDLKDELADVQIVLLGLASLVGIDMIDAVREKEKKNRLRNWE